ncbi:MAG: SDR family NAD(P)-dependent oxidoreductase [Gammaproteobacteria bacterium]|nr:SDR family NAD(P)-dependent oxidoreductase [Gammaproteobacteria bacterium]
MGRLEGKRALVTGGTRGIGRAIVDAFAGSGARVVATGRGESGRGKPSETVQYIRADNADSGQVKNAVAAAVDALGGLDLLVNNAGVELEKPLEATTESEWDWVMTVNLKAVYLYSQAAIPHLRAAGGGAIINLGSISASVADPGLAAYNASKAAVLGLTRSIAVEHGRDRIRCNAICPGWIDTDMLAQTFSQAGDAEAARAAIARMHPAGRLGAPADIAAMALWLASDESAFASGQAFTIDGGLTAGSLADPNRF